MTVREELFGSFTFQVSRFPLENPERETKFSKTPDMLRFTGGAPCWGLLELRPQDVVGD